MATLSGPWISALAANRVIYPFVLTKKPYYPRLMSVDELKPKKRRKTAKRNLIPLNIKPVGFGF